jgi:hypothetical protein
MLVIRLTRLRFWSQASMVKREPRRPKQSYPFERDQFSARFEQSRLPAISEEALNRTADLVGAPAFDSRGGGTGSFGLSFQVISL